MTYGDAYFIGMFGYVMKFYKVLRTSLRKHFPTRKILNRSLKTFEMKLASLTSPTGLQYSHALCSDCLYTSYDILDINMNIISHRTYTTGCVVITVVCISLSWDKFFDHKECIYRAMKEFLYVVHLDIYISFSLWVMFGLLYEIVTNFTIYYREWGAFLFFLRDLFHMSIFEGYERARVYVC